MPTEQTGPPCSNVADRFDAGERGDDPVDAHRDPAVRRRAVAQRVEQEAEPRLRLLAGRSRAARTPAAGRRAGGYGSSRRRSRCRRARGRTSATQRAGRRRGRRRSPVGGGERMVRGVPALLLGSQKNIGNSTTQRMSWRSCGIRSKRRASSIRSALSAWPAVVTSSATISSRSPGRGARAAR